MNSPDSVNLYQTIALGRPCSIVPEDRNHGGAHVPVRAIVDSLIAPAASQFLVAGEIAPNYLQAALDLCQSARGASLTNAAAFEEATHLADALLVFPPNPSARSTKYQHGFDLRPTFLAQIPDCKSCPRYQPPSE